MVDPNTIERVAEMALAMKVFGPTADYFGEGLKQWTERATNNVHGVLLNAQSKLGADPDPDAGVPPRVVKGILQEAQFAEDRLTAEYLGGVLASSRSSISRDDRAATLVALVGRMSNYQLRAHYVMYNIAQRALAGQSELNLRMQNVRRGQPLFLPYLWIGKSFDLVPAEGSEFSAIQTHVVSGLVREELIEDEYQFGGPDSLPGASAHDFGDGGWIYRITPLGIELYCAAHGMRGDPIEAFVSRGSTFEIAEPIFIDPGAGLVSSVPKAETEKS